MNSQVPMMFTREQLWCLQRFVRHEAGIPWQGRWPITSVELNDAIAEAILFCEEQNQGEATLILGRGDCYLIDWLVPQDAKSPMGVLLGKEILLRSYRVRATLDGAAAATATGRELSEDEVHSAMEKWKESPAARRRTRRSKTSAS